MTWRFSRTISYFSLLLICWEFMVLEQPSNAGTKKRTRKSSPASAPLQTHSKGTAEVAEVAKAINLISATHNTLSHLPGSPCLTSVRSTQTFPSESKGVPTVPDTEDCLAQIKKRVGESEYRISNWSKIDEDDALKRSMCHNTAAYVVSLFQGRQYPPSADNFRGKISKFLEDNNPVATKLFAPSPSSEHLLFSFNIPQSDHSFVVERLVKAGKPCWRIFQSYALTFTLAEWLDVALWRSRSSVKSGETEIYESTSSDHTQFGSGRCFSLEEFREFLKPYFSYPDLKDLRAYSYPITPGLCERLSGR